MKKVLIVSFYFPPANTIASKRYGCMCKYMMENGYEPYVLAVNAKGDLKVPISEKNILRLGKAKNGTAFLNREEKLDLKQVLMFEIIEDLKLVFRSTDKASVTWFNEVKENFNIIKEKFGDADIILGTYGPICNIMCARYLSKKLNVPWVAELRDLISQYEEDIPKGYKKSKVLDFLHEYYLLITSSGIVTVTKGFKKILKPIYKKKMKVIYNGWDKTNDNVSLKSDEILEGNLYLYYAGYLYEHRLKSMYLFLDAFDKLENKDIKFVVRSTGPQSSNIKLGAYIKKKKLEDRVYIKETCSDAQVKYEQNNSFINIVFSDMEDKTYLLATIPGKVMELININPPILTIANPKSEIADILSNTKKGIVTENEKEIIEFIKNDYKNYRGNVSVINKYSRKYQTKRLCEFLDEFCCNTKE